LIQFSFLGRREFNYFNQIIKEIVKYDFDI